MGRASRRKNAARETKAVSSVCSELTGAWLGLPLVGFDDDLAYKVVVEVAGGKLKVSLGEKESSEDNGGGSPAFVVVDLWNPEEQDWETHVL